MKKYSIYRGVDNEIEFKGLRGQYFYYAAGGGVGCIMTALFLHILGVPILVNILFLVGGLLTAYLVPTAYNKSHGRWGFDKLPVRRLQPRYVVRYQSIRSILKRNASSLTGTYEKD
ncbi:DUF4133 domain-containing protein [Telluribacter sp.]|jgi:hypothetical protein|uniref:DUF4133 domain-containing protein n=1 Tax=Telluribacter sp. TaxID=1978767 RepID=UPI002E13551F|nr:DUF4133 domain-containing protein [Telluribacter sp.]